MPLIAPAESANLIARVLQRQPGRRRCGVDHGPPFPAGPPVRRPADPAGRVGAALRAGLGAYSLQWPGGPGSGQRLSLMIAVLGLAGLAEGIYQAGAGPAGDLAVLPRQPVPAQVRRRYETYSVLFLVCGDARHGADSPDPAGLARCSSRRARWPSCWPCPPEIPAWTAWWT